MRHLNLGKERPHGEVDGLLFNGCCGSMFRLVSKGRSICDQAESQQQDRKVGCWSCSEGYVVIEAYSRDGRQVSVRDLEVADADVGYKLSR